MHSLRGARSQAVPLIISDRKYARFNICFYRMLRMNHIFLFKIIHTSNVRFINDFVVLVFFSFLSEIVKPTSINITSKPKHFASEIEYSINCEVDGSIPETDIRWTQNNRPFKRGKVSYNMK